MQNLIDVGILAYRNGRDLDAIALLQQVKQWEPNNWLATLYLAMANARIGRYQQSCLLFCEIAGSCPEVRLQRLAIVEIRRLKELIHLADHRNEVMDKLMGKTAPRSLTRTATHPALKRAVQRADRAVDHSHN